jgi:hypothetical protein
VRLGSVDFNIGDWVKMPMARAAADMASNHSTDVAVAVASIQAQAAADAGEQLAAGRGGGPLPTALPAPAPVAGAGGPLTAAAARVSTAGLLPNIDRMVSNYISGIFYRATMGLPGLSQLLPYASAYGAHRRIVVTPRRTYTAGMMDELMEDIGDEETHRAWRQVQGLDALLAQGSVPGVATHCLYGAHTVGCCC